MKPSCFLIPDAEKIRSFFRSFSLPKDNNVDLGTINVSKIWIDEAENNWELDYYSAKPADTMLLNVLSDYIRAEFN